MMLALFDVGCIVLRVARRSRWVRSNNQGRTTDAFPGLSPQMELRFTQSKHSTTTAAETDKICLGVAAKV